MIIKAIKNLLKPKLSEKKISKLEAPVAECSSGHFTHGYGFFGGNTVSSSVLLSHDPWFSDPPKSKMQIAHEEEFDNIHEVMYNMATKNGDTTTQLDFLGGSERFQEGWQSGTGLGQFK